MEQLQRWFIRWPIGMMVAFGAVLGILAFFLDRASGPNGTVAADAVLPLCLLGGCAVSGLISDRRRGGAFDDRAGTALAGVLGLALAGFGIWQSVTDNRIFGGGLLLVIGLAVVVLAVDRARRWDRT